MQVASQSRGLGEAKVKVVIGPGERCSKAVYHVGLVHSEQGLDDDLQGKLAHFLFDVQDCPISPDFCPLNGQFGHELAVAFDVPAVKLGLHQATPVQVVGASGSSDAVPH